LFFVNFYKFFFFFYFFLQKFEVVFPEKDAEKTEKNCNNKSILAKIKTLL
jgi:hypothetical protein